MSEEGGPRSVPDKQLPDDDVARYPSVWPPVLLRVVQQAYSSAVWISEDGIPLSRTTPLPS